MKFDGAYLEAEFFALIPLIATVPYVDGTGYQRPNLCIL